MAFPNKKTLEKIRKEAEKHSGSLALADDASVYDRFRYDICQCLVKYANKNKISNRELARKCGISEADMSRMLHHRIGSFSTDKLIRALEAVLPNFKISLKAG